MAASNHTHHPAHREMVLELEHPFVARSCATAGRIIYRLPIAVCAWNNLNTGWVLIALDLQSDQTLLLTTILYHYIVVLKRSPRVRR